MIQHHDQLQSQVSLFKEFLEGKGFIQKIYSTSWYVCITIRFPGATKYIYLGRGGGHEGLWQGISIPKQELRIRDKFLEYLRKHLTSAALDLLEVDEKDRILSLSYFKYSQRNFLQIFWCGRALYFLNYFYDADEGKKRLFLSWQGDVEENNIPDADGDLKESLKKFFIPVGRITDFSLKEKKREKHDLREDIEYLLKEEFKKISGEKEKKKVLKFLEKKKEKIKGDLAKNEVWQNLSLFVQNKNLNLENANEMTLYGIQFKFQEDWNHFKRVDAIYQKIKRLKKGAMIQSERLEKIELEIDKLEEQEKNSVLKIHRPKLLGPVWPTKKERKAEARIYAHSDDEQVKIVEYKIASGIRVAVGKTDKSNDYLRNKWGKKEDYWFHLDNYKSAHAVVKMASDTQLDLFHFRLIGSMIADSSNINLTLVPLVYAQLKNIKGVKGSAGKVLLKKQKFMQVEYYQDWKDKILND